MTSATTPKQQLDQARQRLAELHAERSELDQQLLDLQQQAESQHSDRQALAADYAKRGSAVMEDRRTMAQRLHETRRHRGLLSSAIDVQQQDVNAAETAFQRAVARKRLSEHQAIAKRIAAALREAQEGFEQERQFQLSLRKEVGPLLGLPGPLVEILDDQLSRSMARWLDLHTDYTKGKTR